jgi:hypothetical protein
MLSNYPDCLLIRYANNSEKRLTDWSGLDLQIDQELLSRQPPPREPEHDQDGNRIVSEMIGYSDKGEEVWI